MKIINMEMLMTTWWSIFCILYTSTYAQHESCGSIFNTQQFTLTSSLSSTDECTYQVHKYDPDVCLLNVHFGTFNLANSEDCVSEYFQIGKEKLCGNFLGVRQFSFVDSVIQIRVRVSKKSKYHLLIDQMKCPTSDQKLRPDCFFTSSSLRTEIQSPNYPAPYPSNTDCTYRVVPLEPNTHICKVLVTIYDLDLENSEGCSKDRLVIDKDVFCGRKVGTREYSKVVTDFIVQFTTDGETEQTGFKLTVDQQPCLAENVPSENVDLDKPEAKNMDPFKGYQLFPPFQGNPFSTGVTQCCGREFRGQRSVLVSPGFLELDKPREHNCMYTILPFSPNTCRMRFSFKLFWLGEEDVTYGCINDFIDIGGIGEARFCGCKDGFQYEYYVVGNDPVNIWYHSQGNRLRGFVIEVNQEDCSDGFGISYRNSSSTEPLDPEVEVFFKNITSEKSVSRLFNPTDGSRCYRWGLPEWIDKVKRLLVSSVSYPFCPSRSFSSGLYPPVGGGVVPGGIAPGGVVPSGNFLPTSTNPFPGIKPGGVGLPINPNSLPGIAPGGVFPSGNLLPTNTNPFPGIKPGGVGLPINPNSLPGVRPIGLPGTLPAVPLPGGVVPSENFPPTSPNSFPGIKPGGVGLPINPNSLPGVQPIGLPGTLPAVPLPPNTFPGLVPGGVMPPIGFEGYPYLQPEVRPVRGAYPPFPGGFPKFPFLPPNTVYAKPAYGYTPADTYLLVNTPQYLPPKPSPAPRSCDVYYQPGGTITSVNYPNSYPANLRQCIRIQQVSGYCSVNIQMLDFNVEWSFKCLKDYIKFNKKVRFCGTSLQATTPNLEFDQEGLAYIDFNTDLFKSGTGFRAIFEQIPCNRRVDKVYKKHPHYPHHHHHHHQHKTCHVDVTTGYPIYTVPTPEPTSPKIETTTYKQETTVEPYITTTEPPPYITEKVTEISIETETIPTTTIYTTTIEDATLPDIPGEAVVPSENQVQWKSQDTGDE